MIYNYDVVVKDFNPEFGNANHLKALEIIGKINKEEGSIEEINRNKRQVIYLIIKK